MSEPSPSALRLVCPFCGAPETDRLVIEGQRLLVFRCMFTPQVDPALTDAELADHLRTDYADRGPKYFRSMCDTLHLYVTKGAGARELIDGPKAARPAAREDRSPAGGSTSD